MKYDAFTLRQAQGERVGLSTIEDYPFVLSLSKHEPSTENNMARDPSTATPYMPAGMPLPGPMPDGLDAPFWEGTRNHRLLVQCCKTCGTFQFGPEWICHKCRSDQLGWHECSRRGKVYAFERVWHPVHPALRERGPYLIVLVELPDAGNVRMVGNLLGDPQQQVKVGDAVEVAWEDHEDVTLVQWQLLSAR